MKKFSDFATKLPKILTGDKIKINAILNKEIKVTGYKIGDSAQKIGTKVLTLQFELDGEERIVFTGSNVLIEQIETYKDEIPFLTTIKQVDKYYTFS